MQIKLPDRVLFKISGTPTIFLFFFIVTTSEYIHFRVQCMGPLNSSQDPLHFVSEVLKGHEMLFWDPTNICASAIPASNHHSSSPTPGIGWSFH